jgi:hypothetical protein
MLTDVSQHHDEGYSVNKEIHIDIIIFQIAGWPATGVGTSGAPPHELAAKLV